MFVIDKTLKKPMYQQIIDSIIDQIRHGQLRYLDKLPNEEQSQQIYGISSVIVKKAYKELHRLGYIARKQGSGSYVSYLPQLTIDLQRLPNLLMIDSSIVPVLLVKEDTQNTLFPFLYRYIFRYDSLTIASQVIFSSINASGDAITIYKKLIDTISINEATSHAEAKLADESLACSLSIHAEDAVTFIQTMAPSTSIKTYLRAEIVDIRADAYGQ